MKTLKTALVALSLVIATNVFATNLANENTPQTVAVEISTLLDNPSFLVKEESTVYVEFIVNKENEVVLLSVDCNDADVATFIGDRLNHRVLQSKLEQGKVFTIPVKFVPKD